MLFLLGLALGILIMILAGLPPCKHHSKIIVEKCHDCGKIVNEIT
jgi:hypothetical protein